MQPVTIKIDTQAHLVGHLPGAVADRVKDRLTFANPGLELRQRQELLSALLINRH